MGSRQKADPEFFRVLSLMREIQDAGAVGLRIEQPTNGQPATILFFRSDKLEAADSEQDGGGVRVAGPRSGRRRISTGAVPLRGARAKWALLPDRGPGHGRWVALRYSAVELLDRARTAVHIGASRRRPAERRTDRSVTPDLRDGVRRSGGRRTAQVPGDRPHPAGPGDGGEMAQPPPPQPAASGGIPRRLCRFSLASWSHG